MGKFTKLFTKLLGNPSKLGFTKLLLNFTKLLLEKANGFVMFCGLLKIQKSLLTPSLLIPSMRVVNW